MLLEQISVQPRAFSLMGIRVNALTNSELVQLIGETVEAGESRVIGHHNLHSLYLWHHEEKMREFFSIADYIHIDGMSVILMGRLAGLPLRTEHRATSLEFLPLLLSEAAECGWRLFFLGSEPGVAEKAAQKLRSQHPGLKIRTHHGHFNPDKWGEENWTVLSEINAYRPHILMVGMGMPRQEKWILENLDEIAANVVCPLGAIMDYIAGTKATPPRWLGPLHIEWLYRLVTEPRRLSRRYLIEPWYVAARFALHLLKTGNKQSAEKMRAHE